VLGVVTGLAFEARDLRSGWGDDAPLTDTGFGEAACVAAETLVADGARALVSFGLAGGLAGGLAPGTPIVADRVVDDALTWRLAVAAPLAEHLDARAGVFYAASAPLLTPADKRAAAARTGALAVDMESVHVLTTARRHELPALVVRVVADPAERALPRLAATAARPDGTINPWATAAALLRHPADWPLVVSSARDTARARAGLRRAAAGLARLARQGLLERFLDVPVEDVGRGPLVR
jgi:uridine phosphorylase